MKNTKKISNQEHSLWCVLPRGKKVLLCFEVPRPLDCFVAHCHTLGHQQSASSPAAAENVSLSCGTSETLALLWPLCKSLGFHVEQHSLASTMQNLLRGSSLWGVHIALTAISYHIFSYAKMIKMILCGCCLSREKWKERSLSLSFTQLPPTLFLAARRSKGAKVFQLVAFHRSLCAFPFFSFSLFCWLF